MSSVAPGDHFTRHGGVLGEDGLTNRKILESFALEVVLCRLIKNAARFLRNPKSVLAHVAEPTIRLIYFLKRNSVIMVLIYRAWPCL